MDGDVALCQQTLKRALADSGQTARLCQGQPFLLKQRHSDLPPQFWFGDLSRGKDLVWNRQGHSRCFHCSVTAGASK